ncbi:hypothetical protein ACWDE9_47760 [Streptomyces olivaceoviridis]
MSADARPRGEEAAHAPFRVPILHRLGVMLLDMGRPADARAAFSRVIALGPSADPQTVREAAARLEALDAVSV